MAEFQSKYRLLRCDAVWVIGEGAHGRGYVDRGWSFLFLTQILRYDPLFFRILNKVGRKNPDEEATSSKCLCFSAMISTHNNAVEGGA